MTQEIKKHSNSSVSGNCQNCKKDFVIESDDFGFYEKIKVPPPTFCHWCRFIRRMTWRNDRALYKRSCDLCKKKIISVYEENVSFPAYCSDCWYGDGWEATTYGRDYDFSRPFFEQLKDLFDSVPHKALWQRNSINSDYSNMVAESKNVYLSVSVVQDSENVFYSKSIDSSKDIFDSNNMKNSEQCYENIEGIKNYNSQYLLLSRNCIDSYYLLDCANCSNCFMSSNLRNQQYYINNQPYNKEEYFKEIGKINLGQRSEREKLKKEFKDLCDNAVYRYANMVNTVNSSGNNLLNTKNATYSFDVYDAENFKYSYRAFTSKDCMDYDFSQTSELMYEYTSGGLNNYNVRFAYSVENVQNAEYAESCRFSNNIIGCFGLNKKSYAIFNKVYSKEEFIKLREKIIKHMDEMPYVDKKGRVFKYGEFFPYDLSPYAYNESPAQDFQPLSKDEAVESGYGWKDLEEKNHVVTLTSQNIPEDIKMVEGKIIEEVLGCAHQGTCNHQCFEAFRITEGELKFYRKNNIPLPDKCSNCRYYERFLQIPLPKLYKRICMKCKIVEFETPYAPDRIEKIYCESCYNKEVY